MQPTASIIVPTRARPGYLAVALASISPQARAGGAELLVVDDGPDEATRATALRHGARYVAHAASRGLNAARNTGVDAAASDLLVFVDDDVAVRPGWLPALLAADAEAEADVGVLTGPIHARFEDHRWRSCGRELPPITTQDHGPQDRDVATAWGANMTVRRSAIARAGRFDEARELYGDEQEWQARLRAAGGSIRYVAAAALDHRRAGDDARLRSLAAAAYRRGGASRRFDVFKRSAPALRSELRVLAGCTAHAVRFACPNGIVLTAHQLGRLRAAFAAARSQEPDPDFLSGTSGTVRGIRRPLLQTVDAVLDAEARPRLRRIDAAARTRPAAPSRVLVLGVERPGRLMGAVRAELHRSRFHDVEMHTVGIGEAGKFEHVNALLERHPPAGHDWLLVVDDDVVLPPRFLDRFLFCAEQAELVLAQPAHRRHSHAAWVATRRLPGGAVRESRFVEIGPVTAFAATTFETLLPFPGLRMGWGLDAHWGGLAIEHGWRAGIVDATPILHTAPVGGGYERAAAVAEAQAFLADRPYVTRAQARWTRRIPG
ncbi:MAG TPA: glycosyltransferase family A protein [Solirubrobacteraceae bacterium]|nr:glycosyltransferase family A protein [Solirubrobacteraceae bacterium]